MTINPKLRTLLEDHNINYTKGVLALLAIYHNLPLNADNETFFYETLMQLNVVKVIDKDYKTGKVEWNMPLFMEAETQESAWSWVVNEYRELFRNIERTRSGTPSTCIKRMKAFFATHPDVRKEEVIEATKLYIRTLESPKYLQSADYFIQKGVGTAATSRLEQYILLLRENQKSSVNTKSQMM